MSTSGGCPTCGQPIPVVRRPSTWRQALWGGWTCTRCGAELDRYGRRIGQAGQPLRSTTRDGSTTSDRPAALTLADDRLRHLRPDLYRPVQRLREAVGLSFPWRTHVAEQLDHGDANAAVVVAVAPLRVAAYSAMLDRVALLAFADDLGLVEEFDLEPGTALVTANGYGRDPVPDADLFLSADHPGPWTGLQPLIGDFVSDDDDRLAALRALIPDAEYRRARRLGERYLRAYPHLARDGRPLYCLTAAGTVCAVETAGAEMDQRQIPGRGSKVR